MGWKPIHEPPKYSYEEVPADAFGSERLARRQAEMKRRAKEPGVAQFVWVIFVLQCLWVFGAALLEVYAAGGRADGGPPLASIFFSFFMAAAITGVPQMLLCGFKLRQLAKQPGEESPRLYKWMFVFSAGLLLLTFIAWVAVRLAGGR